MGGDAFATLLRHLGIDPREWDATRARARVPQAPDLAWAVRALLSGPGVMYDDDARDIAAQWIADALGGLPGHPAALSEVRRALRMSRGGGAAEVRRAALGAIPEAVHALGSLPCWVFEREITERPHGTVSVRKLLADEMMRIARSEARAALREVRGAGLGMTDAPQDVSREVGVPDPPAVETQRTDARDLEAQIAAILAIASPQQRDIISALRETDGVIEAAASRLGKPASQVRWQLARLRKKIAR